MNIKELLDDLDSRWDKRSATVTHNSKRNIQQECAALEAEPSNNGLSKHEAWGLIEAVANNTTLTIEHKKPTSMASPV
jgi:hypothetical protein